MDYIPAKRKTRAQKKFKVVGLFTAGFTILFAAGIIASACSIAKKTELETLVGSSYIENIAKGKEESYYISSVSKSGGFATDGYLYHFDDKDKAIEKINVFEKANEKFSITGLNRINSFYPIYEDDRMYVVSDKHLFAFDGLDNNALTLRGHVELPYGEVKGVASDGNDLFVVSKEAGNAYITRYNADDYNFTLVSEGHLYKNDYSDSKKEYTLELFDFNSISTMKVVDNYVYIFTKNELFIYDKDLSGCNYKTLYTKELDEVKASHPEMTLAEQTSLAVSNCLSKYSWKSYDINKNSVVVSESNFNKTKFYYYIGGDKLGSLIYDDKIIMIGQDQLIYSSKLTDLLDNDPINAFDEFLTIHYDLQTPYKLATSDNAFPYYGVGDKAIIRYNDTTSAISVFDLKNMKYERTVEVSYSISEAFLNEKTNNLYYKYKDNVNKEKDRNYLSKTNLILEQNNKTIKGILVACSIICGLCLIATIICLCGYFFKPSAERLIQTGKGLKKHWPIYLIILPSFALLCLFCYYPGISAIITSFFDYKPNVSDLKTWNNFANYAAIFGNAQSLRHFGNMIIFLLADLLIATVPPLIFAFFLTLIRSKKFSGVLRTLLFIPGIIPGVAGVLIWKNCIYGPYGLINTIISAAGGTKINNFFDSQNYLSMISLLMMGFPFVGSYLIFYGCMMNIPKSYYEAAELDGISVWKRFFKIDLPLCLPQLKYVIIMTIIASIQNFSRIWVGMAGDPGLINTPITKMYDLMYNEKDYGLASAYATVLFVILFGLTFVSMRKRAKKV